MGDSLNDIILKIQIQKGTSGADIKSVITEITNASKQANAEVVKQELDNVKAVKAEKIKATNEEKEAKKQAEKEMMEQAILARKIILALEKTSIDQKAAYAKMMLDNETELLKQMTTKRMEEVKAAQKAATDKHLAEEIELNNALILAKRKLQEIEDQALAKRKEQVKKIQQEVNQQQLDGIKSAQQAQQKADQEAAAQKKTLDKQNAEERKKLDQDSSTDSVRSLTDALQAGTSALTAFYAALRLIATDNAFIQASSQYEVNLRNFNAVALQTEEQLKLTHDAIKSLATDEQLAGMTELAKALRIIQTAGFEGAEGMTVLSAANRGAKADLSDITKTAALATSVLNTYSQSAEHAAEIININSKAIKLGKLTQDELNSSMGTAISLSAEAGVEYAQVAAAMATIHKQGVSAHISATEINAVLKAAFHSGADSIEFAKSLGIELSSAAIQLKGVGGFVKNIFDKTAKFGADQQSAIARLIPDIRSLRGLEKLVNDEGKTFNDILAEMKDGSDQTSAALEQQKKTFDYLAKQIGVSSETIKIEMGTLIQDALKPFLEILNEIMTTFIELPEPVKKWLEAITLLGIGIVSITISVGALTLAAKALGIGMGEATAATLFLSKVTAVLRTEILLSELAMGAAVTTATLWANATKVLTAEFWLMNVAIAPWVAGIVLAAAAYKTISEYKEIGKLEYEAKDLELDNIQRSIDALNEVNELETKRNKLKKEGKNLSVEELEILRKSYGTALSAVDAKTRADFKQRAKDLESAINHAKELEGISLDEQNEQIRLKKAGIANLDKYEKEIYNASHTERENAIRKANEEFIAIQKELTAVINEVEDKGNKTQIENKRRAAEDLKQIAQANADEIDKINAKYDEIEKKRRITATNEYLANLKVMLAGQLEARKKIIESIDEQADARGIPLSGRLLAKNEVYKDDITNIKSQDDELAKQEQTIEIQKRRLDLQQQIDAKEKEIRKNIREAHAYDAKHEIDLQNTIYQNAKENLTKEAELHKWTSNEKLKEEIKVDEARKKSLQSILGTHKDVEGKADALLELGIQKANTLKYIAALNNIKSNPVFAGDTETLAKIEQRLKDEKVILDNINKKGAEIYYGQPKDKKNFQLTPEEIKANEEQQKQIDNANAIRKQQIKDNEFHQKIENAREIISLEEKTDEMLLKMSKKTQEEIFTDEQFFHEQKIILKKREIEYEINPEKKDKLKNELKYLEIEKTNIIYEQGQKRIKIEEEYQEKLKAILDKKKEEDKQRYEDRKALDDFELSHSNIFDKISAKQIEVDTDNLFPDTSDKGKLKAKQNIEELKQLRIEAFNQIKNAVSGLGNEIGKLAPQLKEAFDALNDVGNIVSGLLEAKDAVGLIVQAFAFAAKVFDHIINDGQRNIDKLNDERIKLEKGKLELGEQTYAKKIGLINLEFESEVNSMKKLTGLTEDELSKRRETYKQYELLVDQRNDKISKLNQEAIDKMIEGLKKGVEAFQKSKQTTLDLEYDYQKSVIGLKEDSLARAIELIDLETNHLIDQLNVRLIAENLTQAQMTLAYEAIINYRNAQITEANKTYREKDLKETQDYSDKIRDLNQKNYDLLLKIITSESKKRIDTLKSEIQKEIDLIENKAKRIKEIEEGRTLDEEAKKKRLAQFNRDIANAINQKGADFYRANPLDFDTGDGSTIGNETKRKNTIDAFDLGNISYDQMRQQRQQEAIDKYLYYLNLTNRLEDPVEKQQAHDKAMAGQREYYEFIFDAQKEQVETEAQQAAKKLPDLKKQLAAEEKEYDRLVKTLDAKFRDSSGLMKDTYVSDFRSFIDNIQPDISKLGVDLYTALREAMVKFKENDLAYGKLAQESKSSTAIKTPSQITPTTDSDIDKYREEAWNYGTVGGKPVMKNGKAISIEEVRALMTAEGQGFSTLSSSSSSKPRSIDTPKSATGTWDANGNIISRSYADGTPDTGEGGIVRVHPNEMILPSAKNTVDVFKILTSPPEKIRGMVTPKEVAGSNVSNSKSAYYDCRTYYVSGVTAAQEFKDMLRHHDSEQKVRIWKEKNGR